MLWSNIRSWAKEKGYKAEREKTDTAENSYNYTWVKLDNESICGSASSVSKLARSIYNHISNNRWVQHQEDYIANLEIEIKPDGY